MVGKFARVKRKCLLSKVRLGYTLTQMTWETLTSLLAREFRDLRRIPVINFGFTTKPVLDANELRLEELQVAERVDGIVRDFARTRRWPALDERDRYFLRERIRFAYEYCNIAEFTVRRPVTLASRLHIQNERRRLMEWLLIDVWRTSGVINWLDPFISLTRVNLGMERAWELDIAE